MRYHFISEDGAVQLDEEGTVLADVGEAKRECACLCGQLLSDNPDQLWRDGALKLTVLNEHGLVLFQIAVIAFDAPTLRDPLEALRQVSKGGD